MPDQARHDELPAFCLAELVVGPYNSTTRKVEELIAVIDQKSQPLVVNA
jgi:hypothetical protein